MPLVERRYAEALVNIAKESKSIEDFQQELDFVVDTYSKNLEFKSFLLNPEVGTEQKKELIHKAFESNIRKEIMNFLMLLLDKGRIKFLPAISEEFVRLADKQKGILNLTIISAAPLEERQINEIKEKYKKAYGVTAVKELIKIDASLLGGVKVKIGDKVIDGTLKGRLDSLKDMLFK